MPADAAAQEGRAAIVQSIRVDNRSVQTVDGVRVTAPGGAAAEKRVLTEHDSVGSGHRDRGSDRTVVKLVTSNGTEITLFPTVEPNSTRSAPAAKSITQILGEAWFKVTRALSFFEVVHDRFLAAVKGTEFKVAANEREVQFVWLAGHITVSRDVRSRSEEHRQRDPVTLSEDVSAERPLVRYQLNVDEYLRGLQDIQRHGGVFP